MTPQERQLVDDLFDRLAKVESAPRDPRRVGCDRGRPAQGAQCDLCAGADRAGAGRGAQARRMPASRSWSRRHAPATGQSGGFLDSMRDAVFGKEQRGSVPNVPPPAPEPPGLELRPGAAAIAGRQPLRPGSLRPQGGTRRLWSGWLRPRRLRPRRWRLGRPLAAPPFGGGGSFLGTAAAAAAGMVGGSLLLNGIRGMMGGGHHPGLRRYRRLEPGGGSPWSDSSTLAGTRRRHQRYRPVRRRLARWPVRPGGDNSIASTTTDAWMRWTTITATTATAATTPEPIAI